MITPLSGENAASGQATLAAVRLAVQQVNEAGGLAVGGRQLPLEVLVEDSQAMPQRAVDAARKLLFQESVAALVGLNFTRTAIPVANVAENAGIPMITTGSTNPRTTAGKRYVFRVAFVDSFQGRVMARFAREDLEARTAAVLYEATSTYSQDIARVFKQVFEENGGRVTAFESSVTGTRDFEPLLQRIAETPPDVLFLPNFRTEVAVQVQQARTLGVAATLLGSDTWDRLVLPDAAEGFYSHQWHPDMPGEAGPAMAQAYQQAHGQAPAAPAVAAYDAIGLLVQAIEEQGATDPESIRRGLAAIGRYEGASGIMEYRGSGDPIRSAVMLRLQGETVSLFRKIDPD